MKRFKYLALGLFLGTVGLWGLAVTLPHTFAPGDELKSAEMNANFQALRDAVNALEAKLAAVEAGMLALPSREGALAYAYVKADASVPSSYQFNSAGGAITASNSGPGRYSVTVPGFGTAGTVQVSAYGWDARHCVVLNWGSSGTNGLVNVRCYDDTGALADSAFTLLLIR